MPGKLTEFTRKHPLVTAFSFYSVFFLILFIQFPLKKAISGNCDTWLALTYPGYTLEMIKSFFTGGKYGMPMYPVQNPLAYGESAPGVQIIIMILRSFGLYDYWVNYFYISIIFILTALSIFVFAGNFSKNPTARLFAGFVFTCSNMSFAHIDDSIIVFFCIPVLALHFLYRWFETGTLKNLLISAILAGLEIYFSFYVFFYQFLMLAVLTVYIIHRNNLKIKELIKPAGIYFAVSLPISMPHFLFYLYTVKGLDFITPFEMLYTAKMASLNPIDLLLVLPNNMLYPNIGKYLGISMNWGFVRHYNFTGLLALTLFSYSLFKWNRHRMFILLLALTGIFFAAGPVFMFNMKEIFYSPLYIFYKWIPALRFLRVAARAHFIFLLALSIGAAISFEKITEKVNRRTLLIILFFLFQFLENTPMPLKSFDASFTETVPAIYQAVTVRNPNALILELPSTMSIEYLNWDRKKFTDPIDFINKNARHAQLETDNLGMFVNSWDNLFQYNREIIYTNWQIAHKINSVNGVNGYFPTPRMMWQYYINRLPEKDSFLNLKKWGIDYIVWHDFMKIKADRLDLETLRKSGCVKQLYASEKSYLFKITECDE